eukprot:evm.model.scf_473.5 EVM.evm.TU.scf_473.5   scf_473:10976-12121(+)
MPLMPTCVSGAGGSAACAAPQATIIFVSPRHMSPPRREPCSAHKSRRQERLRRTNMRDGTPTKSGSGSMQRGLSPRLRTGRDGRRPRVDPSQRRAGEGGRLAPGLGTRARSDVADASPRPRDLSASLIGDAETCRLPRIRVESVGQADAEEDGDLVEDSPRTPEHRIFFSKDSPTRRGGLRELTSPRHLTRRRRSTGTDLAQDLAQVENLMGPEPVVPLVDMLWEDETRVQEAARLMLREDDEGETSDDSFDRWSKRFREDPDFWECPPAPRRKRRRVVDRGWWGRPRVENSGGGFAAVNLDIGRLPRLESGVSEQTPREMEVEGPPRAPGTPGERSFGEGVRGAGGGEMGDAAEEAGDAASEAASEDSSSPCTLATRFTA